jgi:two-component system, NtrC family, sensor histidine kinase KinB
MAKLSLKVRHLQTRFVLAGILLVATTIVSGLWSAWTFARLSAMASSTLQVSQQTINLTASLSDALEREDDALLLAISGHRGRAEAKLQEERQRFAQAYASLLRALDQPDEKNMVAVLQQHAQKYRAVSDALLSIVDEHEAMAVYYQRVNPALRLAVADCAQIRESNFRTMEQAAIISRDEARRATTLVTLISALALLISGFVAVALARSVLRPIHELSSSLEALRAGDFDRRAGVSASDELGGLAVGFNRMAEAIGEFRRSNLGEVLRAKETLEATLRALPDAVLVIDPDARIVASNPLAKLVLDATGAGEARQVADLPLPAQSLLAIEAALRGERATAIRAEFSRALPVTVSGRQLKFMFTVIPIPEFVKGRFGAAAILYDVTDFARLDELRTELIGVASHELKTPLTTLRMNLMLLAEKADNLTPRQHEILETATLGCRELASTIDELLDLTRIEAGELKLANETIDARWLVQRAISALQQRYEDAGVELRAEPQHGRYLLQGDPVRLSMVLTNLLSNSLKHTPRDGIVSIGVASASGSNQSNGYPEYLQITVSDTGTGVPQEFRDRIFDKFFRVEPHLHSGQMGTWSSGIGLYLCRQILVAHGGTISCETGENGSGTRMVVRFPSYTRAADGLAN